MVRSDGAAALAAALALAGCAAGPQTRDGAAAAPSGALTWQMFAAAGKVPGSDSALRAMLADSSHEVRMVGGREQRYFAPDGTARFRNARTGQVEAGWWTTQASRAFGHSICAGRGKRPAALAGAAAVKNCEHSSSWVGKADGLARGDVHGLGGMS